MQATASGQRPPFWDWLMAQRKRSDPIGDLARDAYMDVRDGDDSQPPRHCRTVRGTKSRWLSYLRQQGACEGALRAAERAIGEWAGLGAGVTISGISDAPRARGTA